MRTKEQICYSNEAHKYAQTGAFVTLCFLQMAMFISIKYSTKPVYYYFLKSQNLLFLGVMFALICLATYVGSVNYLLGTRPIAGEHFCCLWPVWFLIIIL